jgi:hypothetical protein
MGAALIIRIDETDKLYTTVHNNVELIYALAIVRPHGSFQVPRCGRAPDKFRARGPLAH